MLTTDEAAKRLGVTRSRVLELVKNGQLDAQKLAGRWFIDEGSVDERARSADRKGGRPVRGKGRNEAKFMLMNRTHELAQVVYNHSRLEFTHIGEVLDAQRLPIGLFSDSRQIRSYDFNNWWRGRGIPRTRIGLRELLRQASAGVPEELLYRNLGLSLSDQYWIRPLDSDLAWEDINFFDNDFEDAGERIAEAVPCAAGIGAHPDNTSEGNLAKGWEVRDGVRVLVKEGLSYDQEPYNEVVATALHRRLLCEGEYVPYFLERGSSGAACSVCPNFLTNEEEYVPALYVDRSQPRTGGENDFDHYLRCCEALGVVGAREALERMIVCDDILANHDRHYRNFGIVRNVETLACRPAPIFDSGASLWCDVGSAALARGEFRFASKQFEENPARQLLLVEDFSWFDAARLEGFVDEAVGILSADEMLAERLPHIRKALERRVARMIDVAEWS